MQSEEDILNAILAARDGHKSAFSKLVDHYSSRLEAFLRQKLGAELATKVEISDLLQETMPLSRSDPPPAHESDPPERSILAV